MSLKITGIIPPNVTPFDENEEIDEQALRSLIRFWIDSGSSALLANGSNGEAAYMSRDDRKKVLEITVDEVNGKVPILAGTGAPSTCETINLTRDAKEAGANAALVVTPYYYIPNDDELFNHYKSVLDAIDFPLVLYNVPKFTNYNLNIGIARRLIKEYDQIIGIKDSSGLIGRIIELVSYVGDKVSVLAGTGDVILPALEMGASGAVVAIANVSPRLCSNLYNAFQRGDHEEARRLQIKAVHLNDLLVKRYNQISAIKEALNQIGQPAGFPRRPALPLKEQAREEIRRLLPSCL